MLDAFLYNLIILRFSIDLEMLFSIVNVLIHSFMSNDAPLFY